jgi:hypothetical protein
MMMKIPIPKITQRMIRCLSGTESEMRRGRKIASMMISEERLKMA